MALNWRERSCCLEVVTSVKESLRSNHYSKCCWTGGWKKQNELWWIDRSAKDRDRRHRWKLFNNQSDQRTSVSTSMATDWQNITEHPSNRRVRIVAVARSSSSSSSRLVQQVIVQLDGSWCVSWRQPVKPVCCPRRNSRLDIVTWPLSPSPPSNNRFSCHRLAILTATQPSTYTVVQNQVPQPFIMHSTSKSGRRLISMSTANDKTKKKTKNSIPYTAWRVCVLMYLRVAFHLWVFAVRNE